MKIIPKFILLPFVMSVYLVFGTCVGLPVEPGGMPGFTGMYIAKLEESNTVDTIYYSDYNSIHFEKILEVPVIPAWGIGKITSMLINERNQLLIAAATQKLHFIDISSNKVTCELSISNKVNPEPTIVYVSIILYPY